MRNPHLSLRSVCLFVASTGLAVASMNAQVITVPATPQVGSSNPVTAEPLVSRPPTKPCVVKILKEAEFANFTPNSMTYTPPAACPGPWAKVVLSIDFTVTAGIQYDRTAEFFLGGSNIFYGTTAEPGSSMSPSWHVERDVTDLSAVFKKPQTGIAEIGNLVNDTYTGIIYANAALEFYPASWKAPAPVVPDIVVAVDSTGGDAGAVNSGQQVTQVLDLPTNVEKVYLDVISQSQSGDEFWYLCVPSDLSGNLESCGNTAFRETEVTIDGNPAGVAPVYPWIYTGGLDPYLWIPITGVQTLDFKPYRVDLTPFAGVLADGQSHTVGIGVYNADSYFLVTGNVLVYTDHGRKTTTGGILSNTLTLNPNPVVEENVTTDGNGTTTGTVSVASKRKFEIKGYLETSHGRVETTVEQTVDFLNSQVVDVNPNTGPDDQDVTQTSTVDSTTTTKTGYTIEKEVKHFSYPFKLNYVFNYNTDGTYTQAVTSDQKDIVSSAKAIDGWQYFSNAYTEQVKSNDVLQFDQSFNLTAAGVGDSSASYVGTDSLGYCYSRSLASVNHKLTSVKDGKECKDKNPF